MKHSTKIQPIPLGFSQSYILQGEGTVMVDGGMPGKTRQFIKGIQKMSLSPGDIRLLILTHGHYDHIGSACAIKEITGARIAMHEQDADCLERSLKLMPPGVTPWGKFLIRIMAVFMPLVDFPAAHVDIVLDDDPFPLSEFGIEGRVIHTPGHSPGSVSVLLDSGEAFVGDLAMNTIPLRIRPGLPIFAQDLRKVEKSWQTLLNAGATMIYPAHGKPFPAEKIRRVLKTIR